MLAALAFAAAFAAQAAPANPLVDAAWLERNLADPKVVVLFVGAPADYQAKHIPGARLVPNGVLTTTGPGGMAVELPSAQALEQGLEALGVSDGTRIVVAHGRNQLPAATRAVFTLKAAGLDAVLLDGGTAAWERESRAMTAEAPQVRAGSLSPLTLKARIVDAAYVQERLASPDHVVIDARDPQFYSGAQAGFGTQVRGHIKGAKSAPYTSLQKADGTMKSAQDLAAAFKAAGVEPGDEVIAYCHVGQQATVVMMAAEIAGVKAVLYDGSYQDWSQKGLPVDGPPAP